MKPFLAAQAGAILVLVAVSQAAQSSSINKSNQCGAANMEGAASHLRAAIEAQYRSMKHSNQLKTFGHGRNFISDTVEKYIPVGSSFSDAESILCSAGFSLTRRGRHPLIRNGEYAELSKPIFLGSVKYGVAIYADDKWKKVSRVEAEITIMTL